MEALERIPDSDDDIAAKTVALGAEPIRKFDAAWPQQLDYDTVAELHQFWVAFESDQAVWN